MMQLLAKIFNQFDFGQIIIVKFTFLISVVNLMILISIKWDVDIMRYMYIIMPCIVLIVWFVGYILDITGFRGRFMSEKFKHVGK